jgi:hypothetical protein
MGRRKFEKFEMEKESGGRKCGPRRYAIYI